MIDNTGDTFSVTGGATWTQLTGSPISIAAPDSQMLAVFIQRAGGSEPASYTLGSANSGIGGIITIRGVDTTTALDVAVTAASNTSANSSPWNINATGLTTVTGDSLLVMIAGDDVTSSAAVTHTAPASPGTWTKQTEGNSGFLNYGVFTAPKAATGATGTVTAVGTAAGITAGWAAFLIALRTATPPSGGGTTTKVMSDTLAMSDEALDPVRRVRQASDAATLADSAVRLKLLPRAASDALTLTDQALDPVRRTRVAEDATVLSDGTTRYLRLTRRTDDTIALIDSVVKSLAGGAGLVYTKVLSDSLIFSDDAGQRYALRVRTGADAITVTDAALRAAIRLRQATDTAQVSDGAVTMRRLQRTVTDAIGISDELIRTLFLDQISSTEFVFGSSSPPFRFGGGEWPFELNGSGGPMEFA